MTGRARGDIAASAFGRRRGSPSKYRAIPTFVDGIRFASKKEAKRYGELKLMQTAGQINGLGLQPRFPIVINGNPVVIRSRGAPNGRAVTYVADFGYREASGTLVVEDVKGKDLPLSRLKRALVEAIYGIQVRIV